MFNHPLIQNGILPHLRESDRSLSSLEDPARRRCSRLPEASRWLTSFRHPCFPPPAFKNVCRRARNNKKPARMSTP
jgi:hypothetical protein